MTTVKAVALKAPVSLFAQFTLGDVKGGEHAHAYRKSVVRTAIEQAYKGNYSPLTEALGVVAGKSKKSRAYLAGFAAAGVSTDAALSTIKKVPYKGALSGADNADARAAIERLTAESTAAFFAAFDTVMAEPAKAKKAKEEADTGAAAADPVPNADVGDAEGEAAAALVADMDVATIFDAAVRAVQQGMASTNEIAMMRAALAAYDAAAAASASAAAAEGEGVAVVGGEEVIA
jgi:hypothetical protein